MLSGSSEPAGLSLRLPTITVSNTLPITVSALRVPALIADATQEASTNFPVGSTFKE